MTTVSRRARMPLPAVAGLGIAAGLAIVSYGHIFGVARLAGAAGWEAAIIAATVDGLIVMSLATIGLARRHGVKPPPVAKVALIIGVTATGGANLVHGVAYGWAGVAVAIWVPLVAEVAYLLAMAALRIVQTPVATDRPVICGPAVVSVEAAMAGVRVQATTAANAPAVVGQKPGAASTTRPMPKRTATPPAPRGAATPGAADVVQLDAREQTVAEFLAERAADPTAPPVTGDDVAAVLAELSGRTVSGRTGRRVLQRVTTAKAKAAKEGHGDDPVATRTGGDHDRTRPADTFTPATGGHADMPEALPIGA